MISIQQISCSYSPMINKNIDPSVIKMNKFKIGNNGIKTELRRFKFV